MRECDWSGPNCVGLPAKARRTQRFCKACAHDGNNAQNSATRGGIPFAEIRAARLGVAGSQRGASTLPPPAPRPPIIRTETPPPHDHTPDVPVRLDISTVALSCARLALSHGYDVTILRDGNAASLRILPRIGFLPSSSNGQAEEVDGGTGADDATPSLEDFIAARRGRGVSR